MVPGPNLGRTPRSIIGSVRYAHVFNCFHDNHQQKNNLRQFSLKLLLKLAQYSTHGGETWYAHVSNCFHNNHLTHFS